MKLNDLITEADDGSDVIAVARSVIKSMLTDHPDLAETMLFPIVRTRSARRRSTVRKAEDKAFSGYDSDPLTALRELQGERFWVPLSCGLVAWADATAEQHIARADYIRDKIRALALDAERHETAADIITDAKVSCLADLEIFRAGQYGRGTQDRPARPEQPDPA